MLRQISTALLLLAAIGAGAAHKVFSPRAKTLAVVAGSDWLGSPVAKLHGEAINISFDMLGRQYERLTYHIDRCEADWSLSGELFESDWLGGFNDNPIDDYEPSINTSVDYLHYSLRLPNARCRLKLSGNYRLTVSDEDGEPVLAAEFSLAEDAMQLGLSATTNTDTDINHRHQQVSLTLDYKGLRVTDPSEQIVAIVRQNGCEATQVAGARPDIVSGKGLQWGHCRDLIFPAGNEYRKFEFLATTHATMGLDRVDWDGSAWHVWPFTMEPRRNYLTDADADGSFIVRNSDNTETSTTCDYGLVHYQLKCDRLPEGCPAIEGAWTVDADASIYNMVWDEELRAYTAAIVQKQGYYSYRLLWKRDDGSLATLPSEGDYYQTENRYEAYIYYRPDGARTWRLVAHRSIKLGDKRL